jgi:hypothetical protein
LVSALAAAANRISPGGQALCLLCSAALGFVLTRRLQTPGAEVVRGLYLDEPHWWIEVAGERLDSTRGQFDSEPLVSPAAEDGFYTPLERWPAQWTLDQVYMEAHRAFADPAEAAAAADLLLEALEAVATVI